MSEHNRQPAKIAAHRGLSGVYPENTLLAFEAAWTAGVSWIETDVSMLQDETLIIFHDDRQGRTVAGDKYIAEAVWADFATADAGVWRGQAFSGQKVLTLNQLLAWTKGRRLTLNLEIKCHRGRQQQTAAALASVLQQRACQNIVISSFETSLLTHLRPLMPELRLASIHDKIPHNLDQLIADLHLEAVHLDHQLVTSTEQVADITKNGVALRAWTVNETARARQLLDWGVDLVMSDYADSLMTALSCDSAERPAQPRVPSMT